MESGYTQDEKIAELEVVVNVMREHFGDDVATIDGERWTAELHDAEIASGPEGNETYRHSIRFDIAPEDLEEDRQFMISVESEEFSSAPYMARYSNDPSLRDVLKLMVKRTQKKVKRMTFNNRRSCWLIIKK
ncbi:hypothetical protein [Nesterenkonia aerolata]|uniref:Uncharacterized protein n=1 Tax=Nesterenkonia aerolata TaxID=3074079 RepID=A0ABU2DUZ1_9MICC|nr:hypothetical protein [Nesterenkonia sp. LY-0111]MDR8020313.1 hypothetical protein [Nesterenkonia sp. LY-0111]